MCRRHTARILMIAVLVLAAGQSRVAADPVQAPPPVSGGSNYNFYYLDGCYREPYHVVNSFDKAPAIIKYQLAGMKAAGQSRVSIGIFHHRGGDSGTVMDSTGGKLSAQNQQNLAGLLAAVKQAGFAEVSIVMHAMSANDPSGWDNWQADMYQENWQLIQSLHSIIAGAGIPYLIDLGNELTASTGQSVVLRYDQQLWNDYTARFGHTDTVGFSINSNDPGQVLNVGKMYGTSPPPKFDIHAYGSEYDQFVYDDKWLKQLGYGAQPIIIGESYYNDKEAADGFSRAIRDTGRQIYYLTQWPKSRTNNTQCDQVDIAPPTDYSAYKAAGF